MVKKESKEIYSFGVGCIFLSSFLAMFFGIGSYMMYKRTGNDTYIPVIIGGIISLGLFYIFNYIFSKNPKEDLYELNKYLFGKKIGYFINFILFISFMLIACVILYNVSSFLNVEYMPDAPTSLFKLIILVTLIYSASKSLPEIIRANQIFTLITIVLIFIEVIGIYSRMDIRNIEPIFISDKINMLESIIIYVVLSIVPFTMLLMTCKNRIKDSEKVTSILFKMIILTNILKFIIVFVTILVLGKDFINIFRFPEYITLKQFTLFNILERVENLLSLQFYFNCFSMLTFLFYYMTKFLPKSSISKYYSILISIVIFIITSVMFKEDIVFTKIINKSLIYVILIGMLLPILITFFKMIKNNKKA